MNQKERAIVRDLAERVAEVASLPIMAERRAMWKRHNRLERVRPMILVFPEGAWRELLPQSALQCEDPIARAMEWTFRSRLYYHDHFYDDTVIEKEWVVNKVVTSTGWGLDLREVPSHDPTGAWGFDPVINTPDDLNKLRFPEIRYDEETTRRNDETAQEVFGDILDVKLKGISHVSFHLMNLYTRLRGLEQVLYDMYENSSMLHEAMAFLEEGHRRIIEQYQRLNLLSLNNDSTYHSSGGVGYTDELPHREDGFDPDHVRPCDIWASAEAQEMDPVSPEMHEEFILQYEKRLLEPFGLNGYGCCDDLSRKMDYVFRIPHIRRISIAPWADVDVSAERLQGNYIFSWKPKPFHLVGTFDAQKVRDYITHTLDVTRGCVIEMILKDTHTCEHHPERFTQWTAIARKLVEQY
ncbi:MAG: hypothetical protein HY710_00855 [Candidatus Latescibacteria bacterium]|nr:hypothetical protein [Candidatus Latescibacterota bacterium]